MLDDLGRAGLEKFDEVESCEDRRNSIGKCATNVEKLFTPGRREHVCGENEGRNKVWKFDEKQTRLPTH